jgi:hypothetical protein
MQQNRGSIRLRDSMWILLDRQQVMQCGDQEYCIYRYSYQNRWRPIPVMLWGKKVNYLKAGILIRRKIIKGE